MNSTRKTTFAKKVKEKTQDDIPSKKQDEKLKKSLYNVTTPRPFAQSTADIYSRQNSLKPKKSTQPLKTNASIKELKSTPSTSQLKSKKTNSLNSKIESTTKTPRAKVLPFSVAVNSPDAKRKIDSKNETPKVRKEVAQVYKKDNKGSIVDKHPRTSTRTLGEDEVKVLEVDNNIEMMNLSKKLMAQPKAFYVDLNGEQSKLQEKEASEEDLSYEDDFESYESDFDSYHSSSTSEESEKDRDVHTKEERMLDSGTFELRERSATKTTPMEFISEDGDKKTSLTDEGFQDMSSSSAVSSLKVVHLVDLERPLFIDFTKSKENRRKRRIFEKLKQRAKDILSMVTLHQVSFTLFEMKPIPYELYMATFGRANYTQVAIQTFDDGITAEVQTEDIEYGNKWTQHPIKFTKNTIHLNSVQKRKRENNEVELKINNLIKFDNKTNVEIDDKYETNPLRVYLEQKDGAGDDKMLPYDIYLSKTKQIDYSVNRLSKFLKKVDGRISNILSRNAGNTNTSNLITTTKYPFSESYISILSKNLNENLLKETNITGVVFSDIKSNLVITIHASKTTREHKCILSLWDLNVAILDPLKLLMSMEIVEIGRLKGGADGIFVAALKDGTVHLWDLSDDANWSFDSGNTDGDVKTKFTHGSKMRACAYTSSASNMELGHTLDNIVGLEFLTGNTVSLENGNKVLGQICALLKRGFLIIYSIIQERHKNTIPDIGKAFWSKIKLEKYQDINLCDYIVPMNEIVLNNFSLNVAKKRLLSKRQVKSSRPKSAKTFDSDKGVARVGMFPGNSNWETGVVCHALKIVYFNGFDHYLIGKNCGEVLHCKRIGGNIKIDRLNITGDSSSVTVLETSSDDLAYFLAATDTGTIHLCSLLHGRVLLTLDSRNAQSIQTEKCQADDKGRYLGSVAVKQVNYEDKYLKSRLSVSSLVWSCDPFYIISGVNNRIDVWKLTHSDINPYKVYDKAAHACTARDRNMAFLTIDGNVEVHKINTQDDKNMEIFKKYVSLL